MDIKAIEIKSIEYTQTLTAADLERYLADPWQWRDDVRAQLGLVANGHKKTGGGVTKRASKKRAAKKPAKPKAPKAGKAVVGKKFKCPECLRLFQSQGFLDRHLRQMHVAADAPVDSASTTTWQKADAPVVESSEP